jgi:Holliday junction resolvasome RuvABC endonuclease subunit
MRVLGVDPGTASIGWAVVEFGAASKNIDMGKWDAELFRPEMLVTLKVRFDISRAFIEKPVGFAGPQVQYIVETAVQAGIIYGVCKMVGLDPKFMKATEVRKALCGKPQAKDAMVKEALGRIIALPRQTNAHGRDAVAIALVGAGRDLV